MSAYDWVTVVCIIVATLAIAAALLFRARRPYDLTDLLADRLAAEKLRQEREDLEFDAIASYYGDGSHDVLAEVDDMWRATAYAYLERMWALPAAERAQ